jgi:glycosyltransferase involved in cell wall biosynthesis
VFLIDDGSTDDSLSICRSYAKRDQRIVVYNKVNGGQGSARNYALDRVGRYIAFVDSDDYIELDAYEKLVYAIETYDADLAIAGMFTNTGVRELPGQCVESDTFMDGSEDLLEIYLKANYVMGTVWNKLYKFDLWKI